MVHININRFLHKIDELRRLSKITDTFVVGIIETKPDNSLSSSEIEIEGYDFLRLGQSWRGSRVTCYVTKILAYNYKHSFCKNNESIFIDIFFYKN